MMNHMPKKATKENNMTQPIMDLDTVIQPDSSAELSFDPVPEGKYNCLFKDMKDWEGVTYKELMCTVYDSTTNKAKKAEDGKTTLKEKRQNVTVWSSNVTLEILDGEYAGRLLFHRLTTHPSTPFINARFLNGLGAGAVPASQFQNYVGMAQMEVTVKVVTYPEKEMVSKKTGEVIEPHSLLKNECTYFKPIEASY